MESLISIVKNKRVLLINAIRSDIPSGGNTATHQLLLLLRPFCEINEINICPVKIRSGISWFSLKTLPAALFVLWSRYSGKAWLEFFLRASPWLYLNCLWLRWRIRPDVVIFNHHASFLFLIAFPHSRRVLVWHDVPSLKRDGIRDMAEGARYCVTLERKALNHADFNVTLSLDDDKILRRLHGRHSTIIPVIDLQARRREHVSPRGRWLLIGNWTRAENCEGAQQFLLACAELSLQSSEKLLPDVVIHIAGYGSETFISELRERFPVLKNIVIRTTQYFKEISDFDEFALVAPLLRGAGIKLKTIEAWAAGMPVIGTAQAFTGLTNNIWRLGGLRVPSIMELARICVTVQGFEKIVADIESLDGVASYEAYRAAIKQSSFLSSVNENAKRE